MWVTNRERHQRFIHEELLPHWGLKHVATWFWLKVTNSGELVSPLVGHMHVLQLQLHQRFRMQACKQCCLWHLVLACL